MIHKLGAIPSVHDPAKHGPLIALTPYLASSHPYPSPPPSRDWIGGCSYSIYLNNKIGCCTCKTIATLVQCHCFNHGDVSPIKDEDVLKAYVAVSNYDGTPETDNGAMPIDALTYARDVWRVIIGFVKVDPRNRFEMRAAINLFGGVYMAARLPKQVQSQRLDWELPPIPARTLDDEPGSLGGHAYAGLGYDKTHLRTMPWDKRGEQSYDWTDEYVNEAYAVLTERWVDTNRLAPNGLDLTALKRDLKLI